MSQHFQFKGWIFGLSPKIAALTVRLVVGNHRNLSYSFKYVFKSGCWSVSTAVNDDDDNDIDDKCATS